MVEGEQARDTDRFPSWGPKWAAISAAALAIFVGGVLVATLFGVELSQDSRSLIVLLWAILGGLMAALGTGSAAASGEMPGWLSKWLPGEPMQFSIGGALAGAIITALVGHSLFVRPFSEAPLRLEGNPGPREAFAFDDRGRPVELTIHEEGGDSVLLRYPPARRDAFQEIERSLEWKDQRLVVTSAGGPDSARVFLGYIADSSDTVVRLAITPRLALGIGEYFGTRRSDGVRLDTEAACRFLAEAVRKDPGQEYRRKAALTLFHIGRECQDLGLENVVIEAVDARPEPYRSKELGDVYLMFSDRNRGLRDQYRQQALTNYLEYLAFGGQEGIQEVREAIGELLGEAPESCRELVPRIRRALETRNYQRFEAWAHDLRSDCSTA